jgi:hypothetical protein
MEGEEDISASGLSVCRHAPDQFRGGAPSPYGVIRADSPGGALQRIQDPEKRIEEGRQKSVHQHIQGNV